MHNIFQQLRQQLDQTVIQSGLHYLASLNDALNEIMFILHKKTDNEIKLICSLVWQLIEEYKELYTEQELQEDIGVLRQAIDDLNGKFAHFDPRIKKFKNYELMAGLGLNLFQQALEYSDKNYQLAEYEDYPEILDDLMEMSKQLAIEACLKVNLASQIAKQQKLVTDFSLSRQDLVNKTQAETLSRRSQQGLDKRHRTNRAVKQAFLLKYTTEYAKAQQCGVKLSKNAFSQAYSDKYGYQISTLRKWLKGFEPENS